jgi:hypothetical protein
MKTNENFTTQNQIFGINPNTLFLKTLRNSGYNNYTAIADIVDNSLDTEVRASKVKIITKALSNFETGFISIIDNGYGMDKQILNEALKLGSDTGKDASIDLGCYGTGMKAAALSIGRKFVLETKTNNGDLYKVVFDIDEIEKTGKWEVPFTLGSDVDVLEFKEKIESNHGTIITISKLDKVTQDNISLFNGKLIKDFSLIYNIFLTDKRVLITINNVVLKPLDPMLRSLTNTVALSSLNETFKYKNKEYVYNAFFIGTTDPSDKRKDNDDLSKINRNSANAGIYIYRNFRLVGSGLGLGIINKTGDNHLAGLRIELFIDGEDDGIFGSNFLKMIQEKNRHDIDQGFIDKLDKVCTPYRTTAKALNGKDDNLTEDEDMKNRLNKAFDGINNNPHISPTIDGGKNKVKVEKKPKKPTINEGRNKSNTRKRTFGFCEYSLASLGAGGSFVRFLKINGKSHVEINVDHIYYQEFLNKCDDNTLGVVLRMLVSFNLAISETTWHDEDQKNEIFDEFFLKASEQLRLLINY